MASHKISRPVIIKINKPFMLIIKNKNTKYIWFTETVYEPNSWENVKLKISIDYQNL